MELQCVIVLLLLFTALTPKVSMSSFPVQRNSETFEKNQEAHQQKRGIVLETRQEDDIDPEGEGTAPEGEGTAPEEEGTAPEGEGTTTTLAETTTTTPAETTTTTPAETTTTTPAETTTYSNYSNSGYNNSYYSNSNYNNSNYNNSNYNKSNYNNSNYNNPNYNNSAYNSGYNTPQYQSQYSSVNKNYGKYSPVKLSGKVYAPKRPYVSKLRLYPKKQYGKNKPNYKAKKHF